MATDVGDTVLNDWAVWIQQRSGSSPDVALAAAKTASAAFDRGASRNAAALLAVVAAGGDARDLAAQVNAERERVQTTQAELETVSASAELTAGAMAKLKSVLAARLSEDTAALSAFEAVPALQSARGGVPQPVRAPAPPAVPRKPLRLVFQEFLRDQSILIVAYTGAFLLIVATVLFELYGVTGGQGWIRFGAVLALDLVFAVAGWLALRSARLRIVGQAYIAIAALMAPLAFAAAYIFLDLQRSFSVNAALAISGVSCAVLYGLLAARLGSKGYAVLAMLAFPAGWIGLLNELQFDNWWGAGFAPLSLAYFVIAYRIRRSVSKPGRLPQIADWFGHAAALLSIGAAVFLSTTMNTAAWSLAAVFAVLTVAYTARLVFVASTVGATLAELALGAAWLSVVAGLDLGSWAGPAIAPLMAVFAFLGVQPTWLPRHEPLAGAHALPLYLSTAAAVIAALGWPATWPLVITFLGIAAVYGVRQALGMGSRYIAGIAVGGLSAAWIAGVAGWPSGDWTAAAAAALAVPLVVITLLPRPAWITDFAMPARLQAYMAAVVAALLAVTWYAGTGPSWPLSVAFLILAVSLGVQASRIRASTAAWFAMVAFAAAWVAAVVPAGVPDTAWALAMAPLASLFVLAAYFVRPRPQMTAFALPAEVLLHVSAAAALVSSPYVFTSSGEFRPTWTYTAALALLTFAYSLSLLLTRSRVRSWLPAVGVTVTLLAATASLGFGANGFGVILAGLAWGYACCWRLVKTHPVRHFFLTGAALQAFGVAAVDIRPDWLMAALLVIATAALVALAWWAADFRLAFLPAALGTVAWFWCVKAIVPPPTHPSPSDLVRAYVPLPVIYGAAGLGMRWRLGIRWSAALYIVGALVGLGVALGGVQTQDMALSGWSLLGYAVVAYTISAVERWWWGAAAAGLAVLTGTALLLYAAAGAVAWYPLAGSAVALVAYGGHMLWSQIGARGKYWSEVHSYGAIGVAAVTTLSCFAIPDFWVPGANGTLAAGVAALALAAILIVASRVQKLAALEYGAMFATSLVVFWILRRFSVDVPHWLIAPSALAAMVIGLRLAGDARISLPRTIDDGVTIAGAAALLGTALLETATSTDQAWLYTVVLVAEGIVGLLAGIALRSRLIVIAFAAGITVGAIRALFLVIQALPLWLVIGILAVVLLAGAAALALLRERLSTGLHRLA